MDFLSQFSVFRSPENLKLKETTPDLLQSEELKCCPLEMFEMLQLCKLKL